MKRILAMALVVLLGSVFVGLILGQSQWRLGWEPGQVLTLVALNILVGLALSACIFAVLMKTTRTRFGSPSGSTQRAIGAAVVVIGLLLAVASNYFAGSMFRRVLFGFQHSSHLLLSRVGDLLIP